MLYHFYSSLQTSTSALVTIHVHKTVRTPSEVSCVVVAVATDYRMMALLVKVSRVLCNEFNS